MCVRPYNLVVQSRTFGTRRVITAPCGYCIECVKKRQNDWKMRICHESSYWSHVYFFTLTYRESMLPCSLCYDDVYDSSFGVLRKAAAIDYCNKYDCDFKSTSYIKDVQDFIKRIRTDVERKYGHKWDVKYFICSEYGPNPRGTKRPHYHGIIMTDLEYNDLLPYFNNWACDFGRIDFVEVGIEREDKSSVANYVSKYCSKGCFESRLEDIQHKHISRTKSVMSHGIGERWLNDHRHDFLRYCPSFVEVEGDFSLEDVERLWSCTLESDMWQELDNLIDNMRVFDGNNYSYALPRYYKDRLFKVKKTFINYDSKCSDTSLRIAPPIVLRSFYCRDAFERLSSEKAFYQEVPFKNSFCLTFRAKIRKDVRYVQENFLSCAIAMRLQQRFLARDKQDRLAFGETFYIAADCSLHSTYEDYKRASLEARESIATAQLLNFYQRNMWKNRILDFDADTYTAQDFANFFNN